MAPLRPFARAVPFDAWLIFFPGVLLLGLNLALLLAHLLPDQLPILWDIHFLLLPNILFAGGVILLRWRLIAPWRCLVAHARESTHRALETSRELARARQAVAKYARAQQVIVAHTRRGIGDQYRAVLTYANYLEEQIAEKKAPPELRYDFDDLCEASFNLRLIAGALTLLDERPVAAPQPVPLAPLLQQMILALVPSLDRRSMKLASEGVDLTVVARADASTLLHVVWMVLLGIIRYAEAESTLSLRCHYDEQRQRVKVSVMVNELSPGRLSPFERGHYLARQLQRLHPHMFAETIRIHANLQFAELLLGEAGTIAVLPLSAHACEICLVLPAA